MIAEVIAAGCRPRLSTNRDGGRNGRQRKEIVAETRGNEVTMRPPQKILLFEAEECRQ